MDKPEHKAHFVVNLKEKLQLISLDKIYYFKAEGKYVVLKIRDRKYLLNKTLKEIEKEAKNDFIRVHRNALASILHLDGLQKNDQGRWQVLFRDIEDTLEVSRRNITIIRRWLRGKH